jgi:hypothetical protein
MSVPTEHPAAATAIRPFQVSVPDQDLAELRRRIDATRWPECETVDDDSQGVPLATMQELARYWATEHDRRRCEAKLNALPQFVTELTGLASLRRSAADTPARGEHGHQPQPRPASSSPPPTPRGSGSSWLRLWTSTRTASPPSATGRPIPAVVAEYARSRW